MSEGVGTARGVYRVAARRYDRVTMLVECVPNFSEGRDHATIERLAAAVTAVPGVALLDRHSDPDHHRTVLTFAGAPAAVSEAAFRAVAVAVEAIDMRRHTGVHPRLGAADVVPFVPLRGVTMQECVALADALAERLARELKLPVYLYGHAARRPERARLPWLRRPELEGLAEALATPERAPDVGPARPHPTAGATVVGARGLLLAFNLDLASSDLALAKRIARAIRESSGGLPGVQARGLTLPLQGRVQVTTNLTDLARSGPGLVFAEVERLAQAEGTRVAACELVGLMPRAAVREAAEVLLRLPAPLAGRVLEDRLEAAALLDPGGPLERTTALLASPAPDAPGGGTGGALALALGLAALRKAIALSRGGKGALDDDALDALEADLPTEGELLLLAREDHEAWAGLLAALQRPKDDPGRAAAVKAARRPAVAVPERLIGLAALVGEAAARVAREGNPNLVNDAALAAELALAAGRVGRLNARANAPRAERPDHAEALARLEAAVATARTAAG